MTKKLFILATVMLCASLVYYGLGKTEYVANTKSEVTDTKKSPNSTVMTVSTSNLEGVYTAAADEKDCKAKKMTLEVLASSTSYMTEEFIDCRSPVEMKSWDGTWQEVDGNLVIGLKNGEQSEKFNFLVDKTGRVIKLSSKEPAILFTKTSFKNYKSEYKNISAEYGQYGEGYFVRLWSPNGVLLASLVRDTKDNASYTDGVYVWEVGATSTLLSASSTNETFVEQPDEQN